MLSEDRLLGHYRLVRPIGRGGMGEVYLAEDTRINRQVAIKVVHTEIEPYPDPVKMQDNVRLFQREMRVITMLDHPHILPLFDFGEEKDGNMILIYMVMPYRQEGSLVDWLQQRGNGERLMPNEVSHFVTQAADALQHAHGRNLIHQDVKPSNFLMHNRSGDMLPDLLLMDFGTAKMTTATLTASQSIRGTPAFMAPEQWEGQPQRATDQYALAIMAYLLLTGDTPFSGRMEQIMHQHLMAQPQPPGSLNPAISPELDAVILRALEKQPAARFPSILEFAQAFQQALQFPGNQGPIVLAAKKDEAFTISGDAAEPKANPLSVSPSLPSTVYMAKPGELPPTVEVPPHPGLSTQASTVEVSHPGLSVQAPTVAGININSPNRGMLKPPPLAPRVSKKVSGTKKRRLLPRILVALAILVIISSLIGIGLYQTDGNLLNVFAFTNNDATVSAYPSYLSGHGPLLFFDSLSQENKWSNNGSVNNGGMCQFTGGVYHVQQQQSQNIQHCDASGPFNNFAFEVQLTIIQGDCGGMVFRNGGNGYYYYSICKDGTYQVRINTGNSQSNLLKGSNDPAIHNGLNQQNKIAVVASDNTMIFYANEQKIVEVDDNSYSSGSIGLVADSQNGNATDVAYSNARVWTTV